MEAVASRDQNRNPVSSRKMSEHSCLQHGLLVSFRETYAVSRAPVARTL